ncbi:50S ribosomal protein L35 [SAR202 cluster bacterium AD-804-J14_MRT_500m]|nr:50S ribosomal protein L35 [SAR202 cluster bacterium AD-804-J14_MRT_500m]
MPKQKTHKGARARFHVTGTGKLLRRKQMSSHLRRKKPKKVRRTFDRKIPVAKSMVKNIKRLIPHSL